MEKDKKTKPIIIYKSKEWDVVMPHTYDEAKDYLRNVSTCYWDILEITKGKEWFDMYYSNGNFIFIKNKTNDEIYNLHINSNQMINSMNIGISIKKFFSNETGEMLKSYILDFLKKRNYMKEFEKFNLILESDNYKDSFDAEINVSYYG
jgi:hypothetical protein